MSGAPMQGVFWGFDIAAAGMTAELRRSEVVAANLANMHVTSGADGQPYRRRTVAFEEALVEADRAWSEVRGGDRLVGGVRVARVDVDTTTPFAQRYDPGHPDADDRGFVLGSNVDMFREMVDMTVIERSFQANLSAMQAYRNMVRNSVSLIGR